MWEIKPPEYLLETGYVNGKLIDITRLRRIAAASLATGGAEEKKLAILSILTIWDALLERHCDNVLQST